MPVTVKRFDKGYGICMPVSWYGMLKLLYWYAFTVYWIVYLEVFACLLHVKDDEGGVSVCLLRYTDC